MMKVLKVSTALCAGALLVTLPLSHAAGAEPDGSPLAGSAPAQSPAEKLKVDYENGALNSGVEGLTTTHATAPDASGVVRPGHGGAYAVQHKVTLGDAGYESNGAPRSESATDLLPSGQFDVGDVQRYEFSVLLKDWKTYAAGDSDTGDIVFQGKYAGGNVPAFYLMAKRNEIAFRSPHLNQQAAVVPDLRPYVNKWMSFRVDARWTTDETGYFKVSVQLPGESGYKPAASYENVRTYQPDNPADHGYIKWGLYRPSESIGNGDVPTRIVQHDDIRILDLS
ncbi:heparin lyase I family protein [Streptomyces poriferorum]|uniref:Heparin lyase I family protein n=1 Tax=Streptomyces poriferorum TaxID=2798799 RepID=A0ABY9IJ31_9ACTN|nr:MULTISPECIES: heparin lyase I family protein [Streptomyces]MDP5316988.1 heparin lyase I family protein [Streptomyces sp. Alt4]WLQ55265.1 heparin lyase I family protein [Streptomyces sp. Alt2]